MSKSCWIIIYFLNHFFFKKSRHTIGTEKHKPTWDTYVSEYVWYTRNCRAYERDRFIRVRDKETVELGKLHFDGQRISPKIAMVHCMCWSVKLGLLPHSNVVIRHWKVKFIDRFNIAHTILYPKILLYVGFTK